MRKEDLTILLLVFVCLFCFSVCALVRVKLKESVPTKQILPQRSCHLKDDFTNSQICPLRYREKAMLMSKAAAQD